MRFTRDFSIGRAAVATLAADDRQMNAIEVEIAEVLKQRLDGKKPICNQRRADGQCGEGYSADMAFDGRPSGALSLCCPCCERPRALLDLFQTSEFASDFTFKEIPIRLFPSAYDLNV
jgi:hypothetical protein